MKYTRDNMFDAVALPKMLVKAGADNAKVEFSAGERQRMVKSFPTYEEGMLAGMGMVRESSDMKKAS